MKTCKVLLLLLLSGCLASAKEKREVRFELQSVNRQQERRLLGEPNPPPLPSSSVTDSTSSSSTTSRTTSKLFSHGGTHFAEMFIGSPPQRQTLIIDTGSHYMSFPCKGCSLCGSHNSDYFSLGYSHTAEVLGCTRCEEKATRCEGDRCVFSQRYVEGSSWSAVQVEDFVWLGGSTKMSSADMMEKCEGIKYVFGCQMEETGLFVEQKADGILGLAMHENGFVSHLYEMGVVDNKVFTLCFHKEGGLISFGGGGSDRATDNFETDLRTDKGHFAVDVVGLYLGGEEVVSADDADADADADAGADADADREGTNILQKFNTGKGTIIDSGTTDTYLNAAVAKRFRAVWKKVVGKAIDNRLRVYETEEKNKLPMISLKVKGGGSFDILPENYLEAAAEGGNFFVNRIYLDEEDGAVLGANAMFGKSIRFDESLMRISVEESNCGKM